MKYVLHREDGGVSIMTYFSGNKTVKECVESMPYKVISYHGITDSDIPKDRSFRNAWEFKDGKVQENHGKSVEIHKDKLRKLRKPLLEELDIQYMQALEKGKSAEVSRIVRKKQALRDVTDVDFPNNVDELRHFIPKELKGE